MLVAGNPNSGKSTLFNALSGARTRVANYPGVTVDRRSATVALSENQSIELTDLPGTYSLAARSREEQIAVESLLGHGPRRPDAILIVADATALARALYLTIEILEIGRPVVIALNMTDEARRDGIEIDVARLEALTGARVVPTVASKGIGTEALRQALGEAIDHATPPDAPVVEHTSALQLDLAELEGLAQPVFQGPGFGVRPAPACEEQLERRNARRLAAAQEARDDELGVHQPPSGTTRTPRRPRWRDRMR